MKKVSIIMASFLGNYHGAAKDRVAKFHRAVKSFIDQSYSNKELIIVSDGCPLTIEECRLNYKYQDNIVLVSIEKQPLFSGNVREQGILNATGDIIAYLDSDDIIGEG